MSPTRSARGEVAAADPCVVGACDAGVVRAFDLFGKRWNGMIIGALNSGPTGFAELRRRVGTITDSVLSDRLAELTSAGLVQRTVSDGRPPSVAYALTSAGQQLLPILHQLGAWASENLPARSSS